MKSYSLFLLAWAVGAVAFSATEEPIDSRFIPTKPDSLLGDWQGTKGYVAQIFPASEGSYEAHLFHDFDESNAEPLAILKGQPGSLSGNGWSGSIADGRFKGGKAGERFDLQHVKRTPPTLGAPPPAGAIVLFDGRNLDAWAKKKGKDWLAEDGPAQWKILDGGIMEVVPATDCLITHRKFGDMHLHVEFRTLGAPSNSGVFLQTRYEANINETYGRLDGAPNAGFDNCTPSAARPKIRACLPPLEWQTFDIDFQAPRFDASGGKVAKARATVVFNGVKIYENQELDPPKGAAGRLGESATGPLMLQEHGMPVQFRNIWLLETTR